MFVSGRTPYGPVAAKSSISAKSQIFLSEITSRVQELKLQLLLNRGHKRETNKNLAGSPFLLGYPLVGAEGRRSYRFVQSHYMARRGRVQIVALQDFDEASSQTPPAGLSVCTSHRFRHAATLALPFADAQGCQPSGRLAFSPCTRKAGENRRLSRFSAQRRLQTLNPPI